jgi:glycine hydroxymethyltransferase
MNNAGMTPLYKIDHQIASLINDANDRENRTLRLIASENYASLAVMQAASSCLMNKYSEGYARKRYYEGQQFIDQVEELAIERMKKVFGAEHVNVQPYSGSPANLAVYLAFCNAGDTVMGLNLAAGGHLTHGHNVSITGKYFRSVSYGVRRNDNRIDMDEVRRIAHAEKPKLIWCGATAYPRFIDYGAFRTIADEVGAILVADIAHVAGLIAGRVHPSPVGIADVVTMTTHKTFRGPRGATIMCKKEHAQAIDKAVFPGIQGGPHNSTTAAIAVAAHEALQVDFKEYAFSTVSNAHHLACCLHDRGFQITTNGTDNHLMLIDLTNKKITGKQASKALDRAGIVVNCNSVPFDPRKPFDPSGIRIGTAGVTSRGMQKPEMITIAEFIDKVVSNHSNEEVLDGVMHEVKELCNRFPAPGIRI